MVKALIETKVSLQMSWSREFKRTKYYQFPVLLAAFVGSSDLVSLLIKHGAELDVVDYEKRNPLHYAAILGHVEVARILCSYGVLHKFTDKLARSPLHLLWAGFARASAKPGMKQNFDKSFAIAEILVQSGMDLDLQDCGGKSVLHNAVQAKHLEVVRKLIELGANVNIRASGEKDTWTQKSGLKGNTPFTLACELYEWDIASTLCNAGAVLPEDKNFRSPLAKIVADGDLFSLQTLFGLMPANRLVGHTEDGEIPLIILAIRSLHYIMDEDSERIPEFRRPFIVPQDREPLGAAGRYRAVIHILLDKGEDPCAEDTNHSTAILEALEHEHCTEIVALLLDHGANIKATNKDGMNALHVGATSGFIPFVELVLSHEVGGDQIAGDGSPTLSLAAANGYEEVLHLLLKQPNVHTSADDAQQWLVMSKFYNAIKSYDLPQLRKLLTSQLQVSLSDKNGQTLLHLAANYGITEIVSGLLALGAKVDARDVRGDTALHTAAKSPNSTLATIEALISGGAKVDEKNFAGDDVGIRRSPRDATALHVVACFGRVKIVRAILKHGQKTPEQGSWQPESSMWKYMDLIDAGSDQCRRTGLMCAVQSEDIPTTKCLLEMGASVNLPGGRGSWAFNALDLVRRPPTIHSPGIRRDEDPNKRENSEMYQLLESYGAELFDW